MVVMKADSTKGRYEWRVEELRYPYKPATYVPAAKAVDDGHGHSHSMCTLRTPDATRGHEFPSRIGGAPLIDAHIGREAVGCLPEATSTTGRPARGRLVEDQPGDVLGRRVDVHHEDRLALRLEDRQDRVVAAEQHVVVEVLVDPAAGRRA